MEKERETCQEHPTIEWTLDFENYPQQACETMVMLSIVIPNFSPETFSGNVLFSVVDIPEMINRYEYSYHPQKRER